MSYLDTSVVVSAIVPDVYTTTVRAWLAIQREPLAISRWVEAEFSSVCARCVRIGGLTTEQQNGARKLFDELVESALEVVEVPPVAFVLAAVIAEKSEFALRAPDALHIAVARVHGIPIASNDRRLVTGAPHFGVTAIPAGAA